MWIAVDKAQQVAADATSIPNECSAVMDSRGEPLSNYGNFGRGLCGIGLCGGQMSNTKLIKI